MYPVSQSYITASKEKSVMTRMKFTVSGDQTVYTDSNILEGSFSISNQCTDTKDIMLGAVYIGEMKGTFRNVNIARNYWNGKTITPLFGLRLADDEHGDEVWEDIHLGVFTIQDATYSRSGVEVVAYDNMAKFDKNFSLGQSGGYLYDFLVLACDTCHVALGNTEAEIRAMPNGNIPFSYYSENDVQTWRDLISWIAQTLGGFATIGRDGKLYIKNYSDTAVDTLTAANRFDGSEFSDYITKYTGISYVDIAAQTTRYTGAAVDDGTTMNLGSNPFLQKQSQAVTAVDALLTEIAKIRYTPFSSSMVGNPAYDLGDVITFSGGLAGTTCTCCLHRYEFNYRRSFEMVGYGANPALASAKSKTDKNIAGLIASGAGGGSQMAFYEYRNVADMLIGAGAYKRIVHFKLASNISTRVQIIIEVDLTATDTDGNDLTFAKATYIVDGEPMLLEPQETYIDGSHVLHLMYILPMRENQITYFDIRLTSTSGTISIPRQGVWAYASGVGIVGDGRWDGELDLEDDAEPILLGEVAFDSGITENVSMRVWSPINGTLSDNLASIGLSEITVASNVSERVLFNKLYLSEETWTQANAHTWANVYQDYIWGRIIEEN